MSWFTFYEITGASVPTPATNQASIFINSATGQPSYKDDTGAVTTLVGAPGTPGTNGTNGTNGVGVPVGGTAGQALTKIDGTDYNTQWSSVMTNPMTTAGDMIVGGVSGTPARIGVGTDGYVWTMVAGSPAWAAGGGGGLTNFTEGVNTSAPNATIPYVFLNVIGAGANYDLAVGPKGNGAWSLQVADNTATGGNKRGRRAVDMQRSRIAAAQVASGDDSVVAGARNTASASCGIALGFGNGASGGGYAVAIGADNSVGSAYGAGLGTGNIIYADYGYAFGENNTVGGTHSIAIGVNCTATGSYSFAGGRYSITRGLEGFRSFASGRFAADGDAQTQSAILRRSTTNATLTVLSSDGAAPSASNQFVMPNTSAYGFKAQLVVRENTTGDSALYDIAFCMKRGANAASTSLVGTPIITAIGSDAGAATWVVSVTANTTLGCPSFEVTGEAAHTLRWVADVYSCVQVVG